VTRAEYLKLAIGAIVFVAVLALLGVLRDLRHDLSEAGQDTRCILRELSDHREKNRLADGKQLEALGGDPAELPTPPTLPSSPEWERACEHILGHHP
jgi:hypothetical protein